MVIKKLKQIENQLIKKVGKILNDEHFEAKAFIVFATIIITIIFFVLCYFGIINLTEKN